MTNPIEMFISLIIILGALIYIEIIFNKKDPEDIDINKELNEQWIGSLNNFIEFKKFQYGRAFSLLSEVSPYVIFSLTLGLIAFKEQIIQFAGITIFSSLIVAVSLFIFKLMKILDSANKMATNNMKILLNRKDI